MENQRKKLPFTQREDQHPLYGRVADLLLPSGYKVTIREQDGGDDDVISSYLSQDDMTGPINRFLAGLIIGHDFDFLPKKNVVKPVEIRDLLLRDKYFILMASRIFSISESIIFNWDWKNGKPPVSYEEDLVPYLWDYNKPFPEPGTPGYFKYMIEPYPEKQVKTRELELSKEKRLRYGYLDGHGENYLMKLSDSERSINSGLKARGIEIFDNNEWVPIKNFKGFKTWEMAKIRDDVDKFDKQFDGMTDIKNPHTNEIVSIPLLSITDFFFPREI